MKFYQVIKLEQRLSEELYELNQRFTDNNCISVNELRNYEPDVLLDEIKKKTEELIKIRFLLDRSNLNIREIIIRNVEYQNIINLLKSTPTSMSNDSINSYTRVELDNIIKEYQENIRINIETIDYYKFVTDIDI